MDAPRRLRREEPERTAPIRNWSTLYRATDSWNANTPRAHPSATEEPHQNGVPPDAVTQGVRLGYQVIEEHLQQGQRVAQQISNRAYNMRNASSDVSGMVERLVRDSTNILSLWLNLMSSLAGSTECSRQAPQAGQEDRSTPGQKPDQQAQSTSGKEAQQQTKVSVEINAQGPTQIILTLSPGAEQAFLATPGLHAMSSEKPPLTDITFLPNSDRDIARLRIHVPVGHPADLYTGVLVDRDTGLPQGTLSVRVGP